MEKISISKLCDLLETMTVERSVDHGYAIVHFGHVAGQPTIAISTCRGEGDCYIIR